MNIKTKIIGTALLTALAFGGYTAGKNLNYNKSVSQNTPIIQLEESELEKKVENLSQEIIYETPENLYYDSKKDYSTSDFSKDSEYELLARLIFGEARGVNDFEKAAVAYSVINRVNDGKKWNGETIKEVILKPYQYSAFNENDPNLRKLKNPMDYEPKSWKDSLKMSYEILNTNIWDDVNKGQTHYFNPKYANPSWKNDMLKVNLEDTVHDYYIEP